MQRVIHLLDVRVNVNHTYTVHMLVMLLTAVTAHSWGQQLFDTAVETFSSVSFKHKNCPKIKIVADNYVSESCINCCPARSGEVAMIRNVADSRSSNCASQSDERVTDCVTVR